MALLFRVLKPFMRSPEAGEISGKYLKDREEVSPAEPRDRAAQSRLWEISEELTNRGVTS